MKKLAALTLFLSFTLALAGTTEVHYDPDIPQLFFAAEKVTSALQGAEAMVLFEIQPDAENPEAFVIERTKSGAVRIVGTDAAGAMYGGLEVAELIRIGGIEMVRTDKQRPYMGMRGIKFNIPLDIRSPSYSDGGDAGQYNIEHVWDFEFWREFIDEAASHRFNYISLWNLHPFPSLVKVPDYPDVALDDVKRAVDLEKKFYNGREQDFSAPVVRGETETLLSMTIDDKISFWKRVMSYGKQRNVDFYFVTWNIFDYGARGKYGIDDSINNPVTADYFRKSVTHLFLTYPDLKGVGITTGENMHGVSNQEKEDWMLKTYGAGVLDVFKVQPDRKITFLHRQHQAGADAIAETFKPLIDHPNVDFIFSYKYAKAHAYSSTKQPFYQELVRDIEGRGDDLKTIWTMRNDSTYLFRWAAPDFMREFVQNIPMDITRGYYFGSDGWIWGRDFTRKNVTGTRPLELQKHWFQWLLWGRLAYDPRIGNERFAGIAQTHFPEVEINKLMEAWQSASMVFPLVTGFHWGPLDYHWYPEACLGYPNYTRTETGFHDVNRFITLPSHPGTDIVTIPEYVESIQNGSPRAGKSPLEVSAELLGNADKSLILLDQLEAGDDKELAETLADIEAMALLSRYYGYKIAGATQLHLYRETGLKDHQSKAVEALEKAVPVWRAYAANIHERYIEPLWFSRLRTSIVDYTKVIDWVEDDVAIARNDPGKSLKSN